MPISLRLTLRRTRLCTTQVLNSAQQASQRKYVLLNVWTVLIMHLARFDPGACVCARAPLGLSLRELYFSWQVVLHSGGSGVSVNPAVEESGRDGPGRGECQLVPGMLMSRVTTSVSCFQMGRKSLVGAN